MPSELSAFNYYVETRRTCVSSLESLPDGQDLVLKRYFTLSQYLKLLGIFESLVVLSKALVQPPIPRGTFKLSH